MAANLQINSSPPAVALIGEGLKYEIERINLPTTGYADCIFLFPNDQTKYLDKYFEIEGFSGTLKFYFKTTPDESGLQLRTWDAADSYTVFKLQVAEDLSKNYLINQYYKPYSSTSGMYLLARDIGVAYNIELSDTDVTGLTEGTKNPGIDDTTESDYKIYVGIILYQSGLISHLHLPSGEDFLYVNTDNKVFPDLSEYLLDLLKSSFTYPYNGVLVNEVEDAILKYYMRYGEYHDGDVQKMYNSSDNMLYAIAGKLKQIDSDFLLAEETDYYSYVDNALRFLTWAPLEKITHLTVPERLYFLITETNCKLMLKAHYTDSYTENEVQTITQDAYTIIEILCGVPELFVGADVSELQSYEVWIADSDDVAVSELRRFIIDHSTYLNTRTLIFKNSFGMFDMLHCTGDLTISDNVKREVMEVLTDDAFRKRIQLAENEVSYLLNSGWLDDVEHKLWLEDLQLSRDANLILGDYLLPLTMKTGKITRQKDRDHNYSLKITFSPDYSDEAYSSIVEGLASESNLDRLLDMLISDYTTRVEADGGTVEATTCLRTGLQELIET